MNVRHEREQKKSYEAEQENYYKVPSSGMHELHKAPRRGEHTETSCDEYQHKRRMMTRHGDAYRKQLFCAQKMASSLCPPISPGAEAC